MIFRAVVSEFGAGNNANCFQVNNIVRNKTNILTANISSWTTCLHISLRMKSISDGRRGLLVLVSMGICRDSVCHCYNTVWGTNTACCGADTGSLEPGQLNDLGQPE